VYEWAGLRLRVYTHPCVYEPSDDTRMAVEALAALRPRWGGSVRVAADLGAGTGALALAASEAYGAWVVATDVNPWAVEAARRTLSWRGTVLACRWASCLAPGFDLATVNPPYLPVEGERARACRGWLDLAWAGGREAVRESCEEATRIAPRVVMVYSSLTGWSPEECLEARGFKVIYRAAEPFFMETLRVVAAEAAWSWTRSG